MSCRLVALTLILSSTFAAWADDAEPRWVNGLYICAAPRNRGSQVQVTQVLEDGTVLNKYLSVDLPEFSDSHLAISAFLNKYCVQNTVVVNGSWCCVKSGK
jgi:hypothetical protein